MTTCERSNRCRRFLSAALFGVIALVLSTAGVLPASGAAPDATLVSKVAPSMIRDGAGGSLLVRTPGGRVVSADGRYVVFVSEAPNVVPGQVPNLPAWPRTESQRTRARNVFLYDRVAATTTLVSHVPGAPTTAANDDSESPTISADGAFVAFESHATNLVGGPDVNNWPDVFVWERATGTVTLVSHVPGAPTTTGNVWSASPIISADGAVVVFTSIATDLVAGTDTSNTPDVFVYERSTGTVSLVSHAVGAPGTAGNSWSFSPVASASGSHIAFSSLATNLVAGTDANGGADVFLYERATGAVTLVSHVLGAPGTAGNGTSFSPVMSAGGAFVAFLSTATDLVTATDTNADTDVFLWERATGTVTLVSHYVGRPDVAGHRRSSDVAITADGSTVAFVTEADLFADPAVVSPGDENNPEGAGVGSCLYDRATGALTPHPGTRWSDQSISGDGGIVVVNGIFAYERATGTSRLVSHVPGEPGTPEHGSSFSAVVSENGAFVVFLNLPPTAPYGEEDPSVGPSLSPDVYLYELATSTRTLVSRRDPARPSLSGEGPSVPAATSADGRWVVFTSHAVDLVAGQVDVNKLSEVFLHDRLTGATTLVSHVPGAPTTTGVGFATDPVISADGAFVAFRQHTDWRSDDGRDDVYLYERATGALTLVQEGLGYLSTQPVINGNGAFVAFVNGAHVYLWERATGVVTLVSHAAGAPLTGANGVSERPVISADGTVVAFVSRATNLVAGTDTNGASDVFLYRRATGTVTLVSHVPGFPGTTGNGASDGPVISADDGYIAFRSQATNLVPGTDLNGTSDVFLYARVTGTVTLVSHVPGVPGVTGNGASFNPVISADGTGVAFVSDATDLVAGTDANGASDVFLYDRTTAAVTLVSHVPGAPGITGNARSREPVVSADGVVVAFESDASNLVVGTDTNGARQRTDVFVHDRSTGVVTLVSHARGAPDTTGDTISFGPVISADGTVVLFASLATNLVASDFNDYADVFAYVHDRGDPLPPAANGPDLTESAVSDPPAAVSPGSRFPVTDTVRNAGNVGSPASATRYYLSLVGRKTPDSKLFGMRAVPGLAPGASSRGTVSLVVPATTVPASYYVVACADDLGRVTESSESNNCTASATPVKIGRADLAVTAVSNPPGAAAKGSAFAVSDTVANQGVLGADASTTRYYLSLNTGWGTADRRLMGGRSVPALAANASFPAAPAPVTVTIPANVPAGTYFLLACADDLRRVMETDETDNCKASATTVTVP
jgi:Tol biopolymer transport system component